MYLQVLVSVYRIISFTEIHTGERNWAVLHNNFKLLLGNAVCLVQSCNFNKCNGVLICYLVSHEYISSIFVLLSLWLHLFVSWLAFGFFIPLFLLYFLQTHLYFSCPKNSTPIPGLLLLMQHAYMKVCFGPIVLDSLSFNFSVLYLHLHLFNIFVTAKIWPDMEDNHRGMILYLWILNLFRNDPRISKPLI